MTSDTGSSSIYVFYDTDQQLSSDVQKQYHAEFLQFNHLALDQT